MEENMKLKSLFYSTPQAPIPITPPPPPPFTESELSAAEQLIQLSVSSGTYAGASGCNSTASASSSTRSVNAPLDDVAEDDDGLWRRNKRYRPIADVYASTVQLGLEGGGMKKEKKRRKRMREGDSC